MIFNSIEFIIFLPISWLIFWYLNGKSLRIRNLFLIAASYLFYGWWDWRFLSLIIVSSVVDYMVGIGLERYESKRSRKILLIISLLVNLGILGFFKYFNFFADSFAVMMQKVGWQVDPFTLRIILPVGISFYTFQTLSYSIDIYRKKLNATHDIFAFFAFVSFFPQLVAGPIERAKSLLPQFFERRNFDLERSKDGLRQILWGFFKKVVIADQLAFYVNDIFLNYQAYDGLVLFFGVLFFAFQIYCDFSGYSDIAIGTAKLFDFDLMQNFNYPYFSRNIGEFWHRWHISLSSWFRDYVYIPLGGSYVPKGRQIFNILVTFTVSGLWHGANWTFVIWGFLNGLYYIPLMFTKKRGKLDTETAAENRLLPSLDESWKLLLTFLFTLLAWVFFRADSVGQAWEYLGRIFTVPASSFPGYKTPLLLIAVLVSIEWVQRTKRFALDIVNVAIAYRWIVYTAILVAILLFGKFEKQAFIYFQF